MLFLIYSFWDVCAQTCREDLEHDGFCKRTLIDAVSASRGNSRHPPTAIMTSVGARQAGRQWCPAAGCRASPRAVPMLRPGNVVVSKMLEKQGASRRTEDSAT